MSNAAFSMSVHEIFQLPDKTVFVGTITSQADFLGPARCVLEMGGRPEIVIWVEGETLVGPTHRGLWTRELLGLPKDSWAGKSVTLRSEALDPAAASPPSRR